MEALPPDKWIEVNLDALEHNYQQVRLYIPEGVGVMGVVKADAYGLGSFEVANLLEQLHVDYLGVTYVQEALELRERGISTPILVFAPARGEQVAESIKNNLTLTVDSVASAALIKNCAERLNRQVKVHIKIDTGLTRFGLEPEEFLALVFDLASDERIVIEGVYTHLGRAGERNSRWAWRQFRLFEQVLQLLDEENIKLKYRHCCNSAAVLRYPEMHLDMVRIGTLLGGQYPVGSVPHALELQNPYAFKSMVLSVKTVAKGRFIGYGGTYHTHHSAQLAVIPVGYRDGLGSATLSHPGSLLDYIKWCARLLLIFLNRPRPESMVKIRGKNYPIRGKVFMQMCIVEIPMETRVISGDEVSLPVRRTVASRDITRIYLRQGEPGRQEIFKKMSTYVTEY
ncbi:MAG: alanine racemase [Methylocystaceae bacterium]